MPSLLLRGLRAATVGSLSTASPNHKHHPGNSSPTQHSIGAATVASASTLIGAVGSKSSVSDHTSSTSVSAAQIRDPHVSSSPIAAFKRRLAHSISGLSLRQNPYKKKSSVPEICGESKEASDPEGSPAGTLLPADKPVSKAETQSSTLSSPDVEPLHLSIRRKQHQRQSLQGYLHKSTSHRHTFIKMATENAQPPVSYSRLQDITTSACEKALGSVTSYNHASTEDWNTTIINTILGTLVEETTPKQSDGGSGQPPFKYVVNSTIIQHAPVSSGGPTDPTLTGRRGMHAASGAFWSNEKDGMWSYKYSAAEKKGLDVVVGVIWIHVG